jgi:hypothetical protein
MIYGKVALPLDGSSIVEQNASASISVGDTLSQAKSGIGYAYQADISL